MENTAFAIAFTERNLGKREKEAATLEDLQAVLAELAEIAGSQLQILSEAPDEVRAAPVRINNMATQIPARRFSKQPVWHIPVALGSIYLRFGKDAKPGKLRYAGDIYWQGRLRLIEPNMTFDDIVNRVVRMLSYQELRRQKLLKARRSRLLPPYRRTCPAKPVERRIAHVRRVHTMA